MNVLLVEDEVPALRHVEALLLRIRPGARVMGRCRTVRETRAFFEAATPVDLVLADIQLGDGLSLDAFAGRAVPIVFTTAYDHHLVPALQGNGIAYLLKPIRVDDLAGALDKYDRLERHFAGDVVQRLATRIVGRRGLDWVGVPVADVAWATVRHGGTWVRTRDGDELLVDGALGALQERLDPTRFYRVNRQYLVSVDAITRVRTAGRGRLELVLHPAPDDDVVVTQEAAAAFRAWFGM